MLCSTRLWRVPVLALAPVIALASSLPVAWGATEYPDFEAAYRQELNDQARYLAYARQADVEGLGEVGSLFRAVARAEEIHAQMHTKLIRRAGGATAAALQPVSVGTTEQNLEAAIENENREMHRTYPALVHRAKQAGLERTAEFLHRVRNAEGQHEVLFSQAQSTLRIGKHSGQRFFYVCPGCGYVTEEITFDKCPDCFGEDERFEMIE
jgi:rubrerythrin